VAGNHTSDQSVPSIKVIHAYLSSGYLPAKQLLTRIAFHDKLSNVVRLQGFVQEVEGIMMSEDGLQHPRRPNGDHDAGYEHYPQQTASHRTILSIFGASDKKLRETRWKWVKQFIRRNLPRKYTDQILNDGTDDLVDLIAERSDKRALEQFLSNLYIVLEEMMPPNLKVLGEVKQQAIQQKIDELHNDALSLASADVYSDYISPKRLAGNRRGRLRRRSSTQSFNKDLTSEAPQPPQHLSRDSPHGATAGGANGSFIAADGSALDGTSTPMSASPVNNPHDASFVSAPKEEPNLIPPSHSGVMHLEDARTCMDFLIVTLCHEFQLDSSQGVALLTSKGDELNDIIVDPSNTEYILGWYHSIKSNMSQLISLLQRDPSSIRFCLTVLSKGLQADSSEIALCVLDILSIFATHFLTQEDFAIHFWKWFIVFQGGLDLILFALNRHRYKAPRVTESGYSIIFQYSKMHLMDLFQNHLPKRLDEDDLLVEFCTEWTEYVLQTYPSSKMALADQNVLPVMHNYALRAANPPSLKQDEDSLGRTSSFNTTLPSPEKTFVAAIHLCIFLWKEYPLAVESFKSDIVNRVRFALLKATSSTVRMDVHEEMFQLLIHLAQLRDTNAAFIQKILMESLKRHFKDRILRSYVLKNFSLLLKQCPKFPPKKILILYTKLSSKRDTVEFSDFEFLNRVASHNFLKWSHAVILINHIANIALGIELPQHADAAQATLLILLSRFKSYPEALDVVKGMTEKFVNIVASNDLDLSEETQECALQCMEHILKKNYSTLSSSVLEILKEAQQEYPNNAVLKDLVAEWDASNREEIISHFDSDDSEMDLNQLDLDSDDEAFFQSDPTPRQPHTPRTDIKTPTLSANSAKRTTRNRRKPNSSHLPKKSSALPKIHERRVASQKSSRSRSREQTLSFVSPSHSEPLPNIRDRFPHLSPQKRLLARRKAEIVQRKEERERRKLEEEKELERQRRKERQVAKKLRAKYERKLNRSRKPLYNRNAKPPLGPRTRNGRHLISREQSPQRELSEAEEVSVAIIDGILRGATQLSRIPRYRSPGNSPNTPRKNSIKASPSPYRRQSLQPASTKFFSQFPADQRKSALFCRKIVDEIIKTVVSGRAKMEIEFRKRQVLERQKKRALWEKKKEKFDQIRKAAQAKSSGTEKESAIKRHEQQLEQQKLEKDVRRKEIERKKLEAQKERNKKLQMQLDAHKKQKEEVLRKKLEEERQEAERKQEVLKKKQELIKKKRTEKKKRLELYKRKMEEERKRQEEEDAAKRKADKERKEKEQEEYRKRKKEKEERKVKRNAAATTIQRVARGYLFRMRLKNKQERKKRKFIKPGIEKYAGSSAKPFSILVFRNNDRFHQGTVVELSPLRFKTWEDVMAYLSVEVNHLTGPILKLFNMSGDRINNISGLEPDGKYLCVGGERVDPRQSIPIKIGKEFHYKRPKRSPQTPHRSPQHNSFASSTSANVTPSGSSPSTKRSFGPRKSVKSIEPSAETTACDKKEEVVEKEIRQSFVNTKATADQNPVKSQGSSAAKNGDAKAEETRPNSVEIPNDLTSEQDKSQASKKEDQNNEIEQPNDVNEGESAKELRDTPPQQADSDTITDTVASSVEPRESLEALGTEGAENVLEAGETSEATNEGKEETAMVTEQENTNETYPQEDPTRSNEEAQLSEEASTVEEENQDGTIPLVTKKDTEEFQALKEAWAKETG